MKKLSMLFMGLLFTSLAFSQLHLLNDEFDDASTMSNWQTVNITEGWNATQIEQQDINTTEPGHLFMMPYTTGWYEDRRAPLLYKLVTGDFVFTTQVAVSERNGTGIPSTHYSLAGPMIRTPKTLTNGTTGWQAGQENYIFLSTGYADENNPTCPGACPPPHFEVKNTIQSVSNLIVSQITSQVVTIRLVRIGAVILVLYQTPSNDFVVHRRYFRDDFPAEMQIGFVTYTDWNKVFTFSVAEHNEYTLSPTVNPNINNLSNNPSMPFHPDLEARFDFARFDEVTVPEELENVNLFSEATDEQLLSFLGYASAATLPITLTDFSAKGDEKSIRLTWTTASEIDNKGFEIQKSTDGKLFKTIGFEAGNGTTMIAQTYDFVDENVLANVVYYYRLKQINLDGTIAFSSIETAFLKQHTFIVNIFPQLVQDEMNISITSIQSSKAQISIYNMMGQLVLQQPMVFETGPSKMVLPMAHLQKGMYQVLVENGQESRVWKVIKL